MAPVSEVVYVGEDTDLFLEHMPGGLFRYHADGNEEFDYLNRGLVEMMGCESEEEFRALTNNSFRGFVHPDDLDRVEQEIQEQVAVDSTDVVTYRIRRKDGKVRWVEDWGRLVTDADGIAWFYVVLLDITEKIMYQEELRQSNERLKILSDFNNDVVFDIDCREGTGEMFGDFRGRFGRAFNPEDFESLFLCRAQCSLARDNLRLRAHAPAHYTGDWTDKDVALPSEKSGKIWCRYQSVVLHDEDGLPYRHVGRLLDTHDIMQRQIAYRMRAERDDLTGVFNRRAAMERVRDYQAVSDGPCALIFIDIDNFKDVNDRYGHPAGDRVLLHLADFLRSAVRSEDIVARFGGDEFAVFVPGVGAGPRLDQLVERIRTEAFEGFDREILEDPTRTLSLSIGVACSQGPGELFDELYHRADEALYSVKRSGKNNARVEVEQE